MHRPLSALFVRGARHTFRHQHALQKSPQRLLNVPSRERYWRAQKRRTSTLLTYQCNNSSSLDRISVGSHPNASRYFSSTYQGEVFDEISEEYDVEDATGSFSVENKRSGDTKDDGAEYDRWKALQENKHMPKRWDYPHTSNIQEGHKLYSTLTAYKSHFVPLLEYENAEDTNRMMERLSTWSIDKLVQEGYTLMNLTAYEYRKKDERLPDGHTFSFHPPTGETFGPNLFTRGVHVTVVPTTDSPLDYKDEYPLDFKNPASSLIHLPKAVVIYSSSEEVRVRFMEGRLKFHPDIKWRLDISASDIAFIRALEAINSLNCDPAMAEAASSSEQQYALRGTYLRDEILGGWPNEAKEEIPDAVRDHLNANEDLSSLLCKNEAIRDWSYRYSMPTPDVREGDPELPLNPSQIQAIALMMRGRLTLVQGPPGTGKTKTIIETLRLLKSYFKVPYPLLVCTYTNVAVDNLVEGIVQAGLNPLRVGNEGGVREGLENWSLQAKMEGHPSWPQLGKLKESLTDTRLRILKLDSQNPNKGMMKEHIKVLKQQISRLRRQMQYEIYRAADVVCTTCLMTGAPSFRVLDFPIAFLDEASMSTEPVSLIPLMHGCEQLALIGDHKQLPPVITSTIAHEGGLSRSLFERLMDENRFSSIMLDIQYRMHPAISAFPSQHFYNTALKDGTVLPSGRVAETLSPPQSGQLSRRKSILTGELPSVLFIHHDNHEISKDRSKANIEELRIVVAIIEDLLILNPEMKGSNIGIISPYVAQTRQLSSILKEDPDWAEYFKEGLGRQRAAEMQKIEVKTVDGFEGREKDVIIFSTVRNNNFGQIGFLADRRRMNVALTRAKRALFVVGSLSTLSKGRYGENVLDERGEEMERDVGKMMIFGANDEWKKYVQFVLANELFVEFNQPLEYSSAEEVAEFERVYQTASN